MPPLTLTRASRGVTLEPANDLKGTAMFVALSVRRLSPGSYEDFRRAWEPEEHPDLPGRIYHARKVGDDDEVVSFGIFAATEDEARAAFDRLPPEQEEERQARMEEFVDEVIADGIYEVVEEIER